MAEKIKAIEKEKATDRDKALIGILERMVGQIGRQDSLLAEIIKNQDDSQKAAASAELRRGAINRDTESSFDKIGDSISRYRSDMLNLVNEQDVINNNLKELNKLVNTAAYSLEKTNDKLIEVDEQLKTQDKAYHDHYEHSLQQAESLPKKIDDAEHKLAKLQADAEKHLAEIHRDIHKRVSDAEHKLSHLHADTEKRLIEMHHDNIRQLEKLQHETTRRLLTLDGMMTALETLLIRTTPPEKKPILIVRVFKGIRSSVKGVKGKLAAIFKKSGDGQGEQAEPETPVEKETPLEPETPVEPEMPNELETPVEPETPIEQETPIEPEEKQD